MTNFYRALVLFASAPVSILMLIWFSILAGIGRENIWKLWALPLSVPFAALDVAYNYVVGTIMFVELPRRGEWLFTDRLIRHKRGGDATACYFCEVLSALDPGHC